MNRSYDLARAAPIADTGRHPGPDPRQAVAERLSPKYPLVSPEEEAAVLEFIGAWPDSTYRCRWCHHGIVTGEAVAHTRNCPERPERIAQ